MSYCGHVDREIIGGRAPAACPRRPSRGCAGARARCKTLTGHPRASARRSAARAAGAPAVRGTARPNRRRTATDGAIRRAGRPSPPWPRPAAVAPPGSGPKWRPPGVLAPSPRAEGGRAGLRLPRPPARRAAGTLRARWRYCKSSRSFARRPGNHPIGGRAGWKHAFHTHMPYSPRGDGVPLGSASGSRRSRHLISWRPPPRPAPPAAPAEYTPAITLPTARPARARRAAPRPMSPPRALLQSSATTRAGPSQ